MLDIFDDDVEYDLVIGLGFLLYLEEDLLFVVVVGIWKFFWNDFNCKIMWVFSSIQVNGKKK